MNAACRALLMALASSSALAAGPIEIKGIRLGMSQFDIMDKHGSLPLENFTIGGVPSKYAINPDFLNGEMQALRMYFNADGFDQVRAVLQGKYPAMACKNSTVSNAMGARFTQTRCLLRGSDGALFLQRFNDGIHTSSLSLINNAELAKQRKASVAADQDI